MNILFLLHVFFMFGSSIALVCLLGKQIREQRRHGKTCMLFLENATHQVSLPVPTARKKITQWRCFFDKQVCLLRETLQQTPVPLRAAVGSRLCNALLVDNLPFPPCLEHTLADCITFSYIIQPTFTVPKYLGSFSQRHCFTSYLC